MEKNLKIRNFICFITFIFINIFVLIEFLLRKNTVNYYNAATFLISYKNGFISRGFIGTILNLIPQQKYLIAIGLVTGIGTVIFTAFLLKQVFHIFFERMDENVCYWFLFMMVSSAAFHFTFRHSHTKMDLFWYLLFIPIFTSFLNFKEKKIRNIIFLFLFSIISILIHQGFIFVIAPFIFVLLWDSDEKKILIPYALTIGITFLLCQFFGKGDFQLIATEALNKVNTVFYYDQETAWGYIKKMLYMEYSMSIFEHFKVLKKEFINVNFKLFLYLSSLNILNIYVLFKVFIYTFKNKTKLYIPFLALTQLPLYLLTIDYERWFILFLLNLQLLIIYKLRKGEKVEMLAPAKYMALFFVLNMIAVVYIQFRFGVQVIQ